jgi:hypothetical protein
MMQTYPVPPIRRPKRMRVRKYKTEMRGVQHAEFVMEYDDGTIAVVTYEEMQARAKRARDGKGLRS